jgi:hypothetical protein
MKRARIWMHLVFSITVGSHCWAQGAPPAAEAPEPLRPWTEWVLHGHEEARCPFLNGGDQRLCAWPARLRLELDDHTGRFTQQWLVYRDGWVPLPGDSKRWPLDVRVDGTPLPLTQADGAPRVRLPQGAHTVTGSFAWDAMPEVLPVPPATGLLALTLRGQHIAFPNRDAQGGVWLQEQGLGEQEENRLDVVVYRHVVDDIPLRLVTRIELRVAGAGRELLLGQALLDAFIPMALESPLPARIEPDGHLRVQLRPGTWTVDLTARHEGPVRALTLPDPNGVWDAEEVWVFEARNQLRLVTVEGVTAIDPQQTELPPAWRQWPAYRMRPGDTMTLVEKQRGDADPAPDRLNLQRTWWLDFDGGGFTMHDQITGTMSRSWRLAMSPPAVLGRVAIDGADQFITQLGGTVGVEVRQSAVRLDADSRLVGRVAEVSAVNWDQDFQHVAGELRLPPGWRLLHATGVDDAGPTWLSTWTLLDLFVVLIIAMAAARLWGRLAGLLALVTLGLTYTEAEAPRMIWLWLLAAEALVRVLPAGRVARLTALARMLAVALLVLLAVPFMVRQVRLATYPALEAPFAPTGLSLDTLLQGSAKSSPERVAAETKGGMALRKAAQEPRLYQYELDPRLSAQTGPGLPTWSWRAVSMRWRGPVERTQRVHLFLLSPRVNVVLAVVRTLLLAALIAVALRGRAPGAVIGSAPAALFLACVLGATAGNARADFPAPELLNELRARLLEPPDCYPNCAAIPRLRFEIDSSALRARLEVDSAADTAIALPGNSAHWSPTTVLLDDQPAAGLMRAADGQLWVQVAPGRHTVLMDGALPDRNTVQIPLPFKPHRVEVHADGWRVDGLHEDGVADDSLQLTRLRADGAAAGAALQPGTLPPFARLTRQLRLGLTWQVETTVDRLTPEGAAVVLEIPLLRGESVTSAGMHVAGGKVLVNLAPNAATVSWQSILPETESLDLHAAESPSFTEVWRLDVSPIWHVVATGIPTVQPPVGSEPRLRVWQPWPGETVTVAVSRPAGVNGQTLTIDNSAVSVSPGLRAADVTLAFTARSSRGGQHPLTLPARAELQSVSINGTVQPIRQEQRSVTLPLVPGTQRVQLTWRQPGGIQRWFISPPVGLGAGSVNADLQIAMPADRWTLFLGGPRLGPAILFWSLLAVLLLAAVGLGRVRLTPLRTHQWFLLGIGLTQVPVWVGMIVAGWLLVLGWRREHAAGLADRVFDGFQVLLGLWTAVALCGLVWSIQQGLLGLPEMQIAGNGSSARLLHWYQDIADDTLPRAWVISVPLTIYRLAMLAWALWLAQALLRWLRWGWSCFSAGGLWRPLRRRNAAPRTA